MQSVKSIQSDKTRGVPRFVALLNPLIKTMLKIGAPVGPTSLITVRGRKTGKSYTTPVGLFETGGKQYVFGTFGNTNWVRNLRVSKVAIITTKGHKESFGATELDEQKAAQVLKEALEPHLASGIMAKFLHNYYGLEKDTSLNDYSETARNHPAFELRRQEEK